MILGGGPGNELYPLTATRAEPAVPFAGLFRLIDIPVSNCVNSGLNNIYVLTQFNATSLNRHLARAYGFLTSGPSGLSAANGGFVETLNATQRPGRTTSEAWYKGTADAVRKFAYLLDEPKHAECEDVLILSGDQLYRMDYLRLINFHRNSGADVTIATTPEDEAHALHMGVLQVDRDLNVLEFHEKPLRDVLPTMSIDSAVASQCYDLCDADERAEKPYAGSMGIYVFKKKVLLDLLTRQFTAANDFSRDILSFLVGQLVIKAYPHTSYWEDVGSLKNYFTANLAIAKDNSRLKLFDRDAPLYTDPRMLPPAKVYNTLVEDTLMGDGCRIMDSTLKGCVLGSCTYIDRGCSLTDTIVFGADSFETAAARVSEMASPGAAPPLGIGSGTTLRRAIVDRNVRIGAGCQLVNAAGVKEGGDNLPAGVVIKDGILVVMRDAVIPPGTRV